MRPLLLSCCIPPLFLPPARYIQLGFPCCDYNISLLSDYVNTYFHFLVIYFPFVRVSA
nr:MAG TPA: hypothetical protein [Caudoviricetes sp.]